MAERRRIFNREFKLQTVELSYSRDSIVELALELGIRAALIYRWRSEFGNHKEASFPGNGRAKMTDAEREIAQLKKELSDARIERDILKKAVGIFSKSDGKYFNS